VDDAEGYGFGTPEGTTIMLLGWSFDRSYKYWSRRVLPCDPLPTPSLHSRPFVIGRNFVLTDIAADALAYEHHIGRIPPG
jgi:hypothetical protein